MRGLIGWCLVLRGWKGNRCGVCKYLKKHGFLPNMRLRRGILEQKPFFCCSDEKLVVRGFVRTSLIVNVTILIYSLCRTVGVFVLVVIVLLSKTSLVSEFHIF